MHFAFRSGQRVFYNILQMLDEMGVSKEIFCLKARKQGISTLVEGILSWFALFVPGSKAAIASADGQKSQIMAGMFFFAIDELPWWLESERTRDKRASDRGIIEWSHIGNQVILQSGSMRGGIGQGTTPNVIHISEASQYTNAVKQIDEGLLKAVTSAPGNFMVIETTGDGDLWTARFWNNCKEFYWKGMARLLPLFLPWFMTPELYPSKSWIKKYKMPKDWPNSRNQETASMTTKCEAYVASTKILREVLGENWKLPDEQQWYWQFNYEEHKRRGLEKSWIRQMPCDDYDALLGEKEKAVGEETKDAMKRSQMNVPAIPVYGLAGDGVPEKHEPLESEIWYGTEAPPRLKFSWTNPGKVKFDWMLVPLKPVPEEKFDPLGKCLIFEEPQPGFDYSIGWDCGTGVGGDRSILSATRVGTDANADVQVAEWAFDKVSNDDIYIYGCALASFYSKYMTNHPHPKICIEQRRKFGDRPYSIARFGMGFRRWHIWGQGFDRKIREDKHIGKNAAVGWFTNEWSRPMLLGAFFGAVENGWYLVRSKWLAEEIIGMGQSITAGGKTRLDHESGEHDDRVFAAAMSYFTMHRHDLMAERSKKRYDIPAEGGIIIERGPSVMTTEIPGGKFWEKR
jgi:hypothetical protein